MSSHPPTEGFTLNYTRITPYAESWMAQVDTMATEPLLDLTFDGVSGESPDSAVRLGDRIAVPMHAIVYNGHAGLGANGVR